MRIGIFNPHVMALATGLMGAMGLGRITARDAAPMVQPFSVPFTRETAPRRYGRRRSQPYPFSSTRQQERNARQHAAGQIRFTPQPTKGA